MLIPTGYKSLPNEQGCYNNQVLFGSTVSRMASALAQLTHCKFLAQAHYNIGQKCFTIIGGQQGASTLYKNVSQYNLMYQTTPLSSHLALIVQCRSWGDPNVSSHFDVELRNTTSNSYSGTVLDYGIRFQQGSDLTGGSFETFTAFTGSELIEAPTNTTPDFPRPLFVPSANRGELLNLRFDFNYVEAFTIHIYDLLIPEVTP